MFFNKFSGVGDHFYPYREKYFFKMSWKRTIFSLFEPDLGIYILYIR